MEDHLLVGNPVLQDNKKNNDLSELVHVKAIGSLDYANILDILDRAMMEILSIEYGDCFITQIQVLANLIVKPSASIPIAIQKSINNTIIDFQFPIGNCSFQLLLSLLGQVKKARI